MSTKRSKVLSRISVLVALALLGGSNHAFAVTYGEINEQRSAVGLPLLTGNNQVDFQMLVKECNRGIEYSCFLAQQLQVAPKKQPSPPTPIPFDINNPLEGLPVLGPNDPRSIEYNRNPKSRDDDGNSRERDCYSNCDEAERGCNKAHRLFNTSGGYSECAAERRACDARCR